MTLSLFSLSNLALDFPKPMALPVPDCICLMKKIHTPINRSIGNQEIKTSSSPGELFSKGCAIISILFFSNLSISPKSFGEYVVKLLPSLYLPTILFPLI